MAYGRLSQGPRRNSVGDAIARGGDRIQRVGDQVASELQRRRDEERQDRHRTEDLERGLRTETAKLGAEQPETVRQREIEVDRAVDQERIDTITDDDLPEELKTELDATSYNNEAGQPIPAVGGEKISYLHPETGTPDARWFMEQYKDYPETHEEEDKGLWDAIKASTPGVRGDELTEEQIAEQEAKEARQAQFQGLEAHLAQLYDVPEWQAGRDEIDSMEDVGLYEALSGGALAKERRQLREEDRKELRSAKDRLAASGYNAIKDQMEEEGLPVDNLDLDNNIDDIRMATNLAQGWKWMTAEAKADARMQMQTMGVTQGMIDNYDKEYKKAQARVRDAEAAVENVNKMKEEAGNGFTHITDTQSKELTVLFMSAITGRSMSAVDVQEFRESSAWVDIVENIPVVGDLAQGIDNAIKGGSLAPKQAQEMEKRIINEKGRQQGFYEEDKESLQKRIEAFNNRAPEHMQMDQNVIFTNDKNRPKAGSPRPTEYKPGDRVPRNEVW